MRMDGPIRRWIALVLAVALPLCCCSLRFGQPGRGDHREAGPGDELPACCRGEAPVAAAGPAGPGESTPAPAKPCSCVKGKLAVGVSEKSPADDVGPASVASFVAIDPWMATPARASIRADATRAAGVYKPPATLLRLHCALIV